MWGWLKKWRKGGGIDDQQDRQWADAILTALTREVDAKPPPANLETEISKFETSHVRRAFESGYRMRQIERRLFGNDSGLSLFHPIKDILDISGPDGELVQALRAYFNRHDFIGMGEPADPYRFISHRASCICADAIVGAVHGFFEIVEDDISFELLHRAVAEGYEMRLSEELIEERRKSVASFSR